ncbi:MAG: hypothetical protein LBJ02_11730 [Bifidobacteriaceae bacterium]|nr:hypothetical protein [Bifidobacteriaceae bacterium]
MRFTVDPASAPVYAPNSLGGPAALASSGGAPTAPSESPGWSQDGELVRSAASLHAEDNDFSQARTMIAEVFDAPASGRFVDTLAGQYRGLTRPEVKARFFEYWEAVDRELPSAIRAAL